MDIQYDDLPLQRPGPPLNAWGQFGSSDELGRLNLITPEVIKAGLAEVKHGIVVNLNLPMNVLPVFSNRIAMDHKIEHRGICNDDVVTINTQSTSQWDGFRHFPYQDYPAKGEYRFYGGQTMDEAKDPKVLRNGIQNFADHPITSRAHLLDIPAYLSRYGMAELDPLTASKITLSVLQGCTEDAGIEYRKGDILIVHTGFADAYSSKSLQEQQALVAREGDARGWCGVEASDEVLRWHWENGFAAVATDTSPSNHEVFLGGWGLPIGELFDTRELAKQCKKLNQYTFFFTSMVLNVPAGIASPPNAQAIL